MKLHTEILSDIQLNLLPKVSKVSSSNGFYLAGGTMAALWLGHRRSVDFDWFSKSKIDDADVLERNLMENDLPLVNSSTRKGTLYATIEKVQNSWIEYPYPLLQPTINFEEWNLQCCSLQDIATMKLTAISSRGAKKDFVDIYAIVKHGIGIYEMLQLFRKRFGHKDVGHILYALTYFDDAEPQDMPEMLWDKSWEEIKRTIQSWVKSIQL